MQVKWGLAVAVGLASGLAGYVFKSAQVRRAIHTVEVLRIADRGKSPAVSPDGQHVAYVVDSEIWVDGKAVARGDGPRWSGDGSSLIYFANWAVWETPAKKLVDGASDPADLSHRGNRLAYFRGFVLMEGDRVVGRVGSGSNLRWSPDDKKLAFVLGSDVMVVDVASGEMKRVAAGKSFCWVPDGSGLIVADHDLWLVPRTGDKRQLTFGEEAYEEPDSRVLGEVVARHGDHILMFKGLR